MFSSDDVSRYINGTFEPAWESIRPAPLVTIDFGNGHTITRTLNGNVATHVCTGDGTVLDVLPGIYTETVYRRQLEQLALLHRYALESGERRLAARLKIYHDQQAEQLAKNQPANVLVEGRAGPSILVVENTVRLVAAGGRTGRRPGPPARCSHRRTGWRGGRNWPRTPGLTRRSAGSRFTSNLPRPGGCSRRA